MSKMLVHTSEIIGVLEVYWILKTKCWDLLEAEELL